MYTVSITKIGDEEAIELYRQLVEEIDIAAIAEVVNRQPPERRATRSDKGTHRKRKPVVEPLDDHTY
jgi:hypothetical protein